MEDVKQALDKYKKLTRQDVIHYLSKLTQLVPTPKYKDKLLIPYKDKLLPIDLKEVSCFYTADKKYLYLLERRECVSILQNTGTDNGFSESGRFYPGE